MIVNEILQTFKNFTKFYNGQLNFTNFTIVKEILQSFTKFYKILQTEQMSRIGRFIVFIQNCDILNIDQANIIYLLLSLFWAPDNNKP